MPAEKNIMKPRNSYEPREPKEFEERVIEVARVSRVAKGGRRIRFRVLVVIGNHNGKIGMGVAKATEVAEAVKKAVSHAKKHIFTIPIIEGSIPYEVNMKHGGANIMLKPATSGTSIVAGGSIRSVAEMAGITDLLAKSLGSSNKINNVTATIKALSSFNPDIVAKLKTFAKKAEAKKVVTIAPVVEKNVAFSSDTIVTPEVKKPVKAVKKEKTEEKVEIKEPVKESVKKDKE